MISCDDAPALQSSKGLAFPFVAVIDASFVHKAVADDLSAVPAPDVAFTRITRELLVTCYREHRISRQLEHFSFPDQSEISYSDQQ